MPMICIQFQFGFLSLPDFLHQFGTEAQCEVELEQAHWPQSFVCPCCGHTAASVFRVGSATRWQPCGRNKDTQSFGASGLAPARPRIGPQYQTGGESRAATSPIEIGCDSWAWWSPQ